MSDATTNQVRATGQARGRSRAKTRGPQFHTPTVSVSPQDRRRFVTLGVLAVVVILLFWVATLPLNLRSGAGQFSGPNELLTVIRGGVSDGNQAMRQKTEGLFQQAAPNQ
jgi:hypothetical protein